MKQFKLTADEVSACQKSAEGIGGIGGIGLWYKLPEGHEYWNEVYKKLVAMVEHGTSDGKPWVEPEPEPFVPTQEWLCKFILTFGRFPIVNVKHNEEARWRNCVKLHCVNDNGLAPYFSGSLWFHHCKLAEGESQEVD